MSRVTHISCHSVLLCNRHVKDIDDIRRANLLLLQQEVGGAAVAATMLEMSHAQFANLRDGAKDSKTGKRRGMRKETARRIESLAMKPQGWLDIDHDLTAGSLRVEDERPSYSVAPTSAWASYNRAPPATRAAIDLLLLPKRDRDEIVREHAEVFAGIRLLEDHAEKVLALRKTA